MASSSVEWDQGASVKLDEGGRASEGDSRWSSGGWDGNEMMGERRGGQRQRGRGEGGCRCGEDVDRAHLPRWQVGHIRPTEGLIQKVVETVFCSVSTELN